MRLTLRPSERRILFTALVHQLIYKFPRVKCTMAITTVGKTMNAGIINIIGYRRGAKCDNNGTRRDNNGITININLITINIITISNIII